MPHYLLTEADEQRLFKAKMLLNLLEGLADAAQGEPIKVYPSALSVFAGIVNDHIPDSADLDFVANP